MKIGSIIMSVCVLLICCITGCDDYERKGVVTPAITVNTHSLSLFVGENDQLTASPAGLSFSWTSEDTKVATVNSNGQVSAVGDGSTFIVVTSGDMTCKVPIDVVTKIPLTGFSLSVTSLEVNPGVRRSIIITPEPLNANDASFPVWRSQNAKIATVDYKGEITGVGAGETKIECTINKITKVVDIDVWITKPFRSHVLSAAEPYTMKAIDFDFGGQNNAYYDSDSGNSGSNAYRANNGDADGGRVDIGGDLAVGWTSAGEWLIYTLDVQDGGNYKISTDAAVNAASSYRIELLNGEHMVGDFSNWVNITGTVSLISNGSWSNWTWQDISQPIALPAGTQKIRFYFVLAQFNFRNLRFTYVP